MSNVSLVTHLLPTVNEGFISTLSATITGGTTTVPLNDITGLVNGTTFVGIVDPGLAKQQVFTGTVDITGAQITGVKWTRGTNVSHAGGSTVVDYVTGTAFNMVTRWASIQHNDDGTHSIVTATSVTTTGAVAAGTNVSAAGNVTATGNLGYGSWVTPVAVSTASTSSLTPSASTMIVTALAANITINAPSGTPVNGQKLLIRLKDNGTARTITHNSIFRAGTDVALPTTTVISKTMYMGYVYNADDTKWDIVLAVGGI